MHQNYNTMITTLISTEIIEKKLSQLFETQWIVNCWKSFEQLFNKLFK